MFTRVRTNMEWVHQVIKTIEPVQYVYGIIALCGGVARYLNGYTDGRSFKFSVFVASAFVAGFSGWMFALIGENLRLPQEMLFVMAGTGGFFGEQTMKLVLDYSKKTLKT